MLPEVSSVDIQEDKFRERFPSIAERSNPAAIRALFGAMTVRSIPAGTTLIRDGDRSETLYFLWEGEMTSYVEGDSETIRLGQVPPGQWVGEVSMLDPGPATATVTTDTDCTVLVLTQEAFEELERAQPQMASQLLRALSGLLIERLRHSSTLLFDRFALDRGPQQPQHHGVRDWFIGVYRRLLGHLEAQQ